MQGGWSIYIGDQIVLKSIRCFTLVAVAIMVTSLPLAAQGVDDEWEPEESLPYVGAGAGFVPGAVFMNLDELNKVARELQVEEFKGPLILWGGNLIFSPAAMRNWRLGIYGAGGYKISYGVVELPSDTLTRSLNFTVGVGGLSLERAIRITPAFTVLPGVTAGFGTYAFGLAQTHEDGNDFNQIVRDSTLRGAGGSFNRYGRFIAVQLFVRPVVLLEYSLTGMVMARIGVGYNFTPYISAWSDDAGAEIRNFPNLRADGPTIHLGIFGGLFTN
jgi:hypothetical protein